MWAMEKTKIRLAGINVFALILFAVFLGMITACATSPETSGIEHGSGLHLEWERVYGGVGDDYGQQAIATPDGGLLLMGTTQSEGIEKLWLLKVDGRGDVLWERIYLGARRNHREQLLATFDGGYLIIGSRITGNEDKELWLLKVNGQGDKEWEHIFQDSKYDGSPHAVITPDNGYLIVGTIWGEQSNSWDVWLAKVDAQGNLLWEKTYGGALAEWGADILSPQKKEYLVLATRQGPESPKFEIWLLKIDDQGEVLWDKAHTAPDKDMIYYTGKRMIKTPDGGYLVLGDIDSEDDVDTDALLLKLDAKGELLWRFVRGYGKSDEVNVAVVLPNGNYLSVGSVWNGENGSWDMWLFEVGKKGAELRWEQKYGGTGEDGGNDVLILPDGGLLVIGSTESNGNGGSDLWLFKFAPYSRAVHGTNR